MKIEEIDEIAKSCAALLGEEPKEFHFDEKEYETDRKVRAASLAGFTFVTDPSCCYSGNLGN